jgi:hypothetical protein
MRQSSQGGREREKKAKAQKSDSVSGQISFFLASRSPPFAGYHLQTSLNRWDGG